MIDFLSRFFRGKKSQGRLAAALYFVNGRILIGPQSLTRPGFYLSHSYMVVEPPFTADRLAAELRKALDGSSKVLPGPNRAEFDRLRQEQLKLAGVRSHKAFMADAKHLSVEERDGALEIQPFLNCGKDGFSGDTDNYEDVPSGDLLIAAKRILAILGL